MSCAQEATAASVFDVAPPVVETDLDQVPARGEANGSKEFRPNESPRKHRAAWPRIATTSTSARCWALRIVSRVVPNRMLTVINKKMSGS
jgi:hypothetical protein